MVGGRKRHEAEVVRRAGKAIFFFFDGNVAFFFFSGIGVVKLAGAAEVCLLRVTSLAVVELEVDCCCGGRSLAALVTVAAFAFAPPSSLERVHHYRREAGLEAADAAVFSREPDEAPVFLIGVREGGGGRRRGRRVSKKEDKRLERRRLGRRKSSRRRD